jgi:hypothetical protein
MATVVALLVVAVLVAVLNYVLWMLQGRQRLV